MGVIKIKVVFHYLVKSNYHWHIWTKCDFLNIFSLRRNHPVAVNASTLCQMLPLNKKRVYMMEMTHYQILRVVMSFRCLGDWAFFESPKSREVNGIGTA